MQSTSHKEMEKAISKKCSLITSAQRKNKSIIFEGGSLGEFLCLTFCPQDVLCSLALFRI